MLLQSALTWTRWTKVDAIIYFLYNNRSTYSLYLCTPDMDEMPSKQQLILLVNSLCKLQDKILSVKGMPKHIQQPIADKVEPLKAPMFFMWERLGYGSSTELSPRGIVGHWMASFHTSPPDFLSECIRLLRTFEIPINEYDGGIDLQKSLINFYSDLIEMYEI